MILTIILLAPLGWQSYQFVQEATFNRKLNDVVRENVESLGAKVNELEWFRTNEVIDEVSNEVVNVLNIEIEIVAKTELLYDDSRFLQETMAAELQQTVKLNIKQVIAAELDPSIPPTLTPTPKPGITPSSTPTLAPTLTPTFTSTLTPTYTVTSTFTPTYTPTYTPTPALAIVYQIYGNGVNLQAFPEGPAIGWLRKGDQVRVLYGYEIVNGWVWIEVQDNEGRVGWLPQFMTALITETPTRTPTATLTSETDAGSTATPTQ